MPNTTQQPTPPYAAYATVQLSLLTSSGAMVRKMMVFMPA